MSKRQKEHEGCFNGNAKRSKTYFDDSITSIEEPILYVPDTPIEKVRKRRCISKSEDNEKKFLAKQNTCNEFPGSDDAFSDSDTDITNLDVENIGLAYSNFSRYERYLVSNVQDTGSSKIVQCSKKGDNALKTLTVSGEWYYCDIAPGNFLHIVSDKSFCEKVSSYVNFALQLYHLSVIQD